jgi:hypothetical protein
MCNYHMKIVDYARYDSYNKTILLGTAAICVKNNRCRCSNDGEQV